MKFYDVFPNVPGGCNFLTPPHLRNGREVSSWNFVAGRPAKAKRPLFADVAIDGRDVDIAFDPFRVPFVSQRVADLLRTHCPEDVQLIPIQTPRRPCWILNVLRVIDCIDERRSKISYEDDPAELASGKRYFAVTKLVIDPRRAKGASVFYTHGWTALICSAVLRDRLRAARVTGIRYRCVTPERSR